MQTERPSKRFPISFKRQAYCQSKVTVITITCYSLDDTLTFISLPLIIRFWDSKLNIEVASIFIFIYVKQQRFDNVALLHTHKARTDKIRLLDVANEFVQRN